ncbi:hypothetical protein [Candidatus Desulforudis audaxviator]|uniref:Uncharacterized protein n=1 Tax=Desulforudis audaxviator (strain MP104C) TaxID=477974 RepID=B1I2B2_DESAP|nr:hypothetical protein [Candidatus Desulforudis audaxviator]ACA59065.1 hypothetical protein Daud_0522 [Candidatus Desulforudis audaxviator MP104C]AZK59113.1 hypothetical protein Daudx_0558 [Candidatus Desulforudis audaxviator]
MAVGFQEYPEPLVHFVPLLALVPAFAGWACQGGDGRAIIFLRATAVTRQAHQSEKVGNLPGQVRYGMNWRVRIMITLVAYLVLSRFIKPLDAAIASVLLLVFLSMFLYNLGRVTKIDKINDIVRSYLEIYFSQRAAGLPVDDALSNVIASRYAFNIRQRMIIFESLQEMGAKEEDEQVKKAIYLMFLYEEPVPPTRSALEAIAEVIDKQYTALKHQYDQKALRL